MNLMMAVKQKNMLLVGREFYEVCSNETCLEIMLGEGVEAVKNSPHGY
jgi:hypothetical protein